MAVTPVAAEGGKSLRLVTPPIVAMVTTAQNRATAERASLRPCYEVQRSQRQAPVRAVRVIGGDNSLTIAFR